MLEPVPGKAVVIADDTDPTGLDVGQGDAILITTPTGQQVLVDGGPSPAALTAALVPAT